MREIGLLSRILANSFDWVVWIQYNPLELSLTLTKALTQNNGWTIIKKKCYLSLGVRMS